MAPRKPREDCLFCAPNPCTCNEKKPAARTARKTVAPKATFEVAKPGDTPGELVPDEADATKPIGLVVAEQPAVARPRRIGLGAARSLAVRIERPTVAPPPVIREAEERVDVLTSAILIFVNAGMLDADELLRHRSVIRITDKDFTTLVEEVRRDGDGTKKQSNHR